MQFALVILLLIAIMAFYTYRTVALKKAVQYFVSALIMRNNHWFENEGYKKTDSFWKERKDIVHDPLFWDRGINWEITSEDDLSLAAKVFIQKKQETDNWVLCLHSYRSEGKLDCGTAADFFFKKGFNVLVPDLRGHGASGGKEIGLGWFDRLDLILWIKQILAHFPGAQIILYGQGMGAATVLLASGEVLPTAVKLLIADSSYSSIYSVVRWTLPKVSHLPVKRFLRLANRYSKKLVGYPFLKFSVTRQLGSNHLPVLFLHGEEDHFLPVSESGILQRATAGKKKLVTFKGMGHLEAKTKDSEAYWAEIMEFINEEGFYTETKKS